MISFFFKEKFIFADLCSCAYTNSSAKFKQNILTIPFEIIV